MRSCQIARMGLLLWLMAWQSALSAQEPELQASLYAGGGVAFQQSFVKGLDRVISGKPLLFLMADVEYNGFFLESTDRRRGYGFSRDTIGYRLWQDDSSSVALIGSNVNGTIAEKNTLFLDTVTVPELAGIKTRSADFMLALRWQKVQQQHYFSVDAGKDIDYHFGYQGRAFYSYRQTLRNWDLYYNLGILYSSQQAVDYYFGIRPEEVTVERPLYRAGAGYQLQLGVAAVYPLSESLLFESGASLIVFSRAYRDSPLTEGATDKVGYLGVRYVF